MADLELDLELAKTENVLLRLHRAYERAKKERPDLAQEHLDGIVNLQPQFSALVDKKVNTLRDEVLSMLDAPREARAAKLQEAKKLEAEKEKWEKIAHEALYGKEEPKKYEWWEEKPKRPDVTPLPPIERSKSKPQGFTLIKKKPASEIVEKLVRIANSLDHLGLHEKADIVDQVLKLAVELPPPAPERPMGEKEMPEPKRESDRIRPGHPYWEEEWKGYEEEPGPSKVRKPSREAQLIALKNKLLRSYGPQYKDLLTDKVLSQIYNAIGRVDISPMGDYGADKRLDKIMKILLFRDRLRKNKCISCGEETPASYLEKGEDVVSSPVCQECLQKGLDPDVVKFIEKSGLGSAVMPHFEELMDPRKMERKFPYQGSEEYEED